MTTSIGSLRELLVATRGGTVRLSLDLREVTSLSTSAVQLLTDLTSVNRAVGMYAADIEILSTAGLDRPTHPGLGLHPPPCRLSRPAARRG